MDIMKRKKEGLHPLDIFQKRMNKLFDDFWGGDLELFDDKLDMFESVKFNPSINISEDEKAVHVSAELPGMTEKDVEVLLENNILTLKGEKKQEHEEKDKNFHRVERSYGSFYRSINIPLEVDNEKIEANFKNGVLNIELPKKEVSNKGKKIEIKT